MSTGSGTGDTEGAAGRGVLSSQTLMPKSSLPHPRTVPASGLLQLSSGHGIGEGSVQMLIFKLSYCLQQKVSLLGGFRAEGWKPQSVVISSGALPRTPGTAWLCLWSSWSINDVEDAMLGKAVCS